MLYHLEEIKNLTKSRKKKAEGLEKHRQQIRAKKMARKKRKKMSLPGKYRKK